jgi:hypothetical protein
MDSFIFGTSPKPTGKLRFRKFREFPGMEVERKNPVQSQNAPTRGLIKG